MDERLCAVSIARSPRTMFSILKELSNYHFIMYILLYLQLQSIHETSKAELVHINQFGRESTWRL